MQKIETGGTSNTSTPMFRFRTKLLFPLSDALHMTHCAAADAGSKTARAPTIIDVATERSAGLPSMIRNSFNDSLPPIVARRGSADLSSENCPGKRPAADR